MSNLNIILLHDDMVDKQKNITTTSLTMIDLHDIARSTRTYGVGNTFVCHSSPSLRKLASTLKAHWMSGFGEKYNGNRKEALTKVHIIRELDEAITFLDEKYGKLPKLIASSAKDGGKRISFTLMKEMINSDVNTPYLLMLGTGWGMSDKLLSRADYFLEPIKGPTDYNHLSVRAACAIMLDRIQGR
ncbi:MAG: RNA methyltransferase [Bdellovibrionota bacterium]